MTKGDILDARGAPVSRPASSETLADAIRRARVVEAERIDATADLRDSEIARLELLRAELEPIFRDIPAGDDRFALTLSRSRPARLWIDMFAHAAIDADGGYELVRSSEDGRRVLFSSTDLAEMRARVTTYIARQIVLRERHEAGFAQFVRADDAPAEAPPRPGTRWGALVAGFALGATAALLCLIGYVWLTLP
jgi:hypothetical protein